MILSCLFLTDVGGVNAYRENSFVSMSEGDTCTVYLQLRDTSVNTALESYKPVGRRFIPATGATLKVVFENSFDTSKLVTKVASQPFAQDPSIWSFTIQATDALDGTKHMRLELKENGKVTRGLVTNALRVQSVAAGQ